MKLSALIDVIKPKQTLLLMITFLIPFSVAGGRDLIPPLATFLAISGTTALNMWLDRDIDAMMLRTRKRPVPAGELSPETCAIYGTILFLLGFYLALITRLEFALVLLLGLFFDIFVYTVMLKRRSPYSIIIGGLAGAMPALAGWIVVKGFTIPGFIMASIVFLWIPSHIWFIAIHYEEDYRNTGIPMFPVIFGVEKTVKAIILSTILMIGAVVALYFYLPMHPIYFLISIPPATYFLIKSIKFAMEPSKTMAKKMYKIASIKLGFIFLAIMLASAI